jgi:hypothetical protein
MGSRYYGGIRMKKISKVILSGSVAKSQKGH